MNQPSYLSLAEVARRFDVTPQTVRNWIRRGVGGNRLKAYRIGRTVWTTERDLAAFVRPVEAESPAEPTARDHFLAAHA